MTQAIAIKPVEVKTCATCPYFNNFHEPNRRGWCGLFDHYAREHHEQTQDCVLSSKAVQRQEGADYASHTLKECRQTTKGHSLSRHELKNNLDTFYNVDFEETSSPIELEQPEYQAGNIIKIIDEEEDHEEWAVFKVSEVRHNELLHDDIESYLQGSRWYYHLISNRDSKSFGKSIWVAQKEICHFDEGHLSNPPDTQLAQLTDTSTQSAKPKPILKSTLPSTRKEDLYTVIRTWDNGSVYLGSRVESVLVKLRCGNTKPSWETVIKSQGIVKGDVLTRGRGGFLIKASRLVAA